MASQASSRHQQAKDVHRSAKREGGPPIGSHFLQCICALRRICACFAAASRLLSMLCVSKRFVYVLRNAENPPRYYTGLTSDVIRRHAEHNAGNCAHTADHRPWSIDVVIEFGDDRRAVAFERYLKSGSGVAFAQRHLR